VTARGEPTEVTGIGIDTVGVRSVILSWVGPHDARSFRVELPSQGPAWVSLPSPPVVQCLSVTLGEKETKDISLTFRPAAS
jgi:hypothetical protein